MSMTIYAVPVKVVTPVRAYCPSCKYMSAVRERYKDDPETWEHLDAVFPRKLVAFEELVGRTVQRRVERHVYIIPSHVISRIKLAVAQPGRPLAGIPESLGMIFPEKYVSLYRYGIVNAKEQQTLVNIEVLEPDAVGLALFTGSLKDWVRRHLGGTIRSRLADGTVVESQNEIWIHIGGHRQKGNGIVVLDISKEQRRTDIRL